MLFDLKCFFKKQKIKKIENDLDFIKENIDNANGKIVYTHEKSSFHFNIISNCLYLKRNSIFFSNGNIGDKRNFENVNFNYFWICLEKEYYKNLESKFDYQELLQKILSEVTDFVNKSNEENRVWFLNIDVSNKFKKYYCLDFSSYNSRLQNDILNYFYQKSDIFSNSSQKTILNLYFNKNFERLKLNNHNYFQNIVVVKEQIDDFHNYFNILDLINNKFMIEYFFLKVFSEKDNYFNKMIVALQELTSDEHYAYVKFMNELKNTANSTYYFNGEFLNYNYSEFLKYIHLLRLNSK